MVSSSRFPFLLSLIVPLLITITNTNPTHQATDYSFEDNVCFNSATFNGTFGKNLNHLLSSLLSSKNTATSTGFYSSSYGEIPDKVYAIGLCRGDLKPHACNACLTASTSLILENACPNDAKEGGVGSINCTLRYSNSSISGIRVDAPAISGYSQDDKVSSSLEFDFNQRLTTLLERLTSKAAAGSDVRKFAVGHSNAPISSGITIYALVQCSPDLSENDCNVCLNKGLGQLPPCCYNSWTYVGASCSLRYDPYLFYDPETDPTPLPPPSPPPLSATTTSNSGGSESSTSRTVITTLVPIIVSMLLINFISLSKCIMEKFLY